MAVAAGVIYGFSLKATREEEEDQDEKGLFLLLLLVTDSSQWGGFIAMRRVTYKVERSR